MVVLDHGELVSREFIQIEKAVDGLVFHTCQLQKRLHLQTIWRRVETHHRGELEQVWLVQLHSVLAHQDKSQRTQYKCQTMTEPSIGSFEKLAKSENGRKGEKEIEHRNQESVDHFLGMEQSKDVD